MLAFIKEMGFFLLQRHAPFIKDVLLSIS